ncbi:PAAR domain-containing protein [Pseudomonas sp. G(2018)]|uniref:PAAR domain-containing protein n=1 Tax=Pseudomonas sp. G(2018) TaxID=2502242 RepID=UPI0014851F22|nr:PAAR domain-containing protein [Pseudomonas sp. G(2018)]
MARMDVDGLGQGLDGDLTTTGAVCIASLPQARQGERGVLRLGDKTTPCKKCGKEGVIVESLPAMKWDDIPTVLDGARVHCGCPEGTNRLIAPLEGPSRSARSDHGGVVAQPAAPGGFTSKFASAPVRPASQATAEILEEEEEEEELTPGITLRLGLFFDGTGNNLANSEAAAGCYAVNLGMPSQVAEDIRQHCAAFGYDGLGGVPDNSYGNEFTNVARLHDLYPDQAGVRLSPKAEEVYSKAYLEGIGTTSGQEDSIYSQGTGTGGTGVIARVEQMPAQVMNKLRLLQNNNPDLQIRRIEIDLFGFSRGAAAARHCANDLLKGKGSLLAQALPTGSPILSVDFNWNHRTDFILNFIGLFDTVAGIVSPFDADFTPHNAANPGLNLRLAPGIANKVIHLTAGNEYRHNFSLNQTDQEIELPGSHSDLGGGYLPLATEKLLLSKPDSSIEYAHIANERSDAYWRTHQRMARESSRWLDYVPPEGLSIVTWSVDTQHRGRDTAAEKRVYAAIASQRQVRGELSLVYLRIMRELAVRAGVAFDAAPTTSAFAVPTELQPIAAKLRAFALGEPYASLTSEEHSLLRRRYIHLSANWNAAKGWNNSDLGVLFINRPADGSQRREHPNE